MDYGDKPAAAKRSLLTPPRWSLFAPPLTPYYAPDKSVLSATYDFITLSEVAEHLARPGEELDNLWASLAPGGWLGIMTKRVRDRAAFATWHYIADPTHVSFFSDATFRWLADRWSATLVVVGDDVVLFGRT